MIDNNNFSAKLYLTKQGIKYATKCNRSRNLESKLFMFNG